MRLTFSICLFCVLQSFATRSFSQNQRLSINQKNISVESIIQKIEDETDYYFMYSALNVDVKRTVTIEVTNKSVPEILDAVFKGTDISYKINGRLIALSKKGETNFEQKEIKVSGKVTDASGSPLPGVSVVIKGTSRGVITGSDGNYSLMNMPDNGILSFSFVGMKTQEIAVEGKSLINVVMKEETIGIEEVVTIGYGTTKKSDLTGSVASVSAKSFLDQPASSVNSVLSGRAPGVTVRRMNGAPGQGATIRIRGANSLYGGNDPLIVVDGNYGSMPDMYDIESIEILKDASATAIYGSRGANGVILVKTKRGTEKKPTVNLYTNFSFENIPQRYNVMDAYEFAEFNNRVGNYSFTDDELAEYKANGGTNWQDQIFQTGLSQSYKVNISGGSKNVKYYVSPSYNKSTGTVKNTKAENYGLSTKVDMDVSDRISVQVETGVSHSDNLNPNLASGGDKTSIPLMAALVWSPTEPVYDEDGGYNKYGIGTGVIRNPLLLTTAQYTNYSNNGSGVGNIKVKIIDGLVLDAKGSVSFGTGGSRNFESAEYTGTSAYAAQSSYETKSWLVNTILTYSKVFNKLHNFSLMAGFEETQSQSRSFNAKANELPLESVGWDNLGVASNISIGSDYSNGALRSYLGRLNYNFASRYYLTANFRADGSSKFRDGNQWGYFPSFSLAWKLSEEGFMKNQDIFQNVKIRGGWGVTGNQAIDTYETYTTLGSRSWSWGTSTSYSGYYARVGGNTDLKWESTKQTNLGIDLSTLNNQLSVSFDYYDKKTTNLLAPISVPAYNGGNTQYGTASVTSNVGSVRNKGFEFNISYNVVQTKKFSYDFNLNGAINKNRVISLGEQSIIYGDTYAAGLTSTSPFVLMAGQPIGTIYGVKYLGIWQEDESEEAAKYGLQPGDYKYEDLDGDYAIDSNDKQVIGHANPTFTWGFNNHLSFGDFDLNILFEGVSGRDVLNWSYMVGAETGISSLYTLSAARNRWTPSNPDAEFARVGSTNLQPISSQYMENGSYVKLRNVSLSYRIPKNVVSFASFKVSVSVQNMLTITKYKGYDPEICSSAGDDISAGMDWFAYPNPKSFSFGVSLEY